ncbi:hypothetical protein ACQP00_07210 [Dactylosporangium sp. CS-047395]|uniref:hypothetical protein n=1 Tax=Dactylosporangium sp. CS-047395 TaxID=3239936 RepID=UPI003D8F9EC9
MSWTVPPPPPPPGPERPIRTRQVFLGIGLVLAAQVVAVLLGVGAVVLGNNSSNSENGLLGVWLEVILQVAIFVACLTIGIVWIVRKDRGLGLGLLIGWGASVLICPVVGIGVCLAIVSNQGQL